MSWKTSMLGPNPVSSMSPIYNIQSTACRKICRLWQKQFQCFLLSSCASSQARVTNVHELPVPRSHNCAEGSPNKECPSFGMSDSIKPISYRNCHLQRLNMEKACKCIEYRENPHVWDKGSLHCWSVFS